MKRISHIHIEEEKRTIVHRVPRKYTCCALRNLPDKNRTPRLQKSCEYNIKIKNFNVVSAFLVLLVREKVKIP